MSRILTKSRTGPAHSAVPLTVPRVLAVIATLLVRRCYGCVFLIGWFLRCIRCLAHGEFITDAAVEAGSYRKEGTRRLVAAGDR
jgi:hypothetical protein